MPHHMPNSHIPVKHQYSTQTVEEIGRHGHTAGMDNLKNLREARNITQAELADMIGVNQAYISKIEAGIANPSLEKILGIAKALRAQPAELFELPSLQRRAIAAIESMADTTTQEAALVVLEAMAKSSR